MTTKFLILCCMAVILVPVNCQTKILEDDQHARLPEFLSELDLASLEASQEDVESLKKIVKRLAPEAKNGEYLMYQGVMGQPGVDFPVLTTIPATKFSCRGVKGGYYADLETNCQVFHICDNGRKISFLCPNGTVFQQSQLICDWWFKVDCGKSTELYEQSAEQLAEDDRKRAEAKKMNSEFHRSSGKNTGQVYYQTQNQNVDYDGRQNGRTNPFGQSENQNQTPNSRQPEQENGQSDTLQNGRNGNQFGQVQSTASQTPGSEQYNQNYNFNQQRNEQTSRQNFNSNYNSRNGNAKQGQNSQDSFFGVASNSNAPRDQKSSNRNPKAYGESRANFNEARTTASPFKEYQQPAESAAFATSRNNRYNKSFQYNQLGNYYSANQVSSTEKYRNDERQEVQQTKKGASPALPFPTFAPIYKPRTTTSTYLGFTTQKTYVNTDVYRQNTATQTPQSNSETGGTNAQPYDQNSPANYRQNSETPGRSYTGSYTRDTNYPSTQRPYVNTDSYRQGTASPAFTTTTEPATTYSSYDQTFPTSAPAQANNTDSFTRDGDSGNTVTISTIFYTNDDRAWNTAAGVTSVPSTGNDHQGVTDRVGKALASGGNSVTRTTQKPHYRQNTVTGRNLSPYDTSVTYQNGKISSTLGPYIPFTKNYAYTTTGTTTTTRKSPVYTATVPTVPDHRTSGATTETPAYFQGSTPLKGRSLTEREHAIGMLHSLQELEATAPTTDNQNATRVGLNIPPSSGPSTLHTLALYFATASDSFDSNETVTDTAVRIGNDEEIAVTTEDPASAELPTNLLTQHTIKSYSELFNVNSALQPVSNVTTRISDSAGDDDGDYSSKEDSENDLDLQQSQGPVTGAIQRNGNPKLRELAQVFTHALSAYLQDPESFRKVLTEIRPTEPPSTVSTDITESTTLYPTTQDDYPSATKEKDEVLDFSDVTKASRRKKLTTPYPTTTQTITTPPETTYQTYQATSESSRYRESTFDPNLIDEALNEAQSSDFRSTNDAERNDLADEVNHAFKSSGSNDLRSYNPDLSGPSAFSGPSAVQSEYDSYVPETGSRFGGFQNNGSSFTRQPYGKEVKPADATPIGNDYVPESTPASFFQSENPEIPINDEALNDFEALRLDTFNSADNFVTPSSQQDDSAKTTSGYQENEVLASTREPFRINYYDSSTKGPRYVDESLVTAGSVYSTFGNSYNDLWNNDKSTRSPVADVETTTYYPNTGTKQPTTNFWTSSPTVTRLWETTVFLDPKRINHGLTGSEGDTFATGAEAYGTTPVSRQEILVTDASGLGKTSTPNTWKWTPNDNDSPTAFTLLPTVYSTDNTATPAPTYTTHSSIITTISSSVSSSTKPATTEEKSSTSSFPVRVNVKTFNVTENEIIKAQEMFGGLNSSSTNTLMRVMKQADSNSTVRQLVLLLISHCKGPMNKTMEEEKEQLLDALLRMPVNEFSTEESKDIIAGINKLQLPIGRSVQRSDQLTETTTTLSVTTYRSRKGRKFRASTERPVSLNRSDNLDTATSGNALSIEAATPSDNRALELLRSLYTIAAKWG